MRYDLITFDAYSALVDYHGTLLPVVAAIPGIGPESAPAFLDLWRARQLGVAADLERLIADLDGIEALLAENRPLAHTADDLRRRLRALLHEIGSIASWQA